MLCCVQATVLSWSVLIRERFDVEVLCVWFNMFCELVATTFRWRTVCEWRPSCCGNVKGQVCTVEAIHVCSGWVGEHWCLLLYFRITLSRMLKTWWNCQRGARASARFRAEELKVDDVCTAKDKEKKQQRRDTRTKPVYQRQVCGISKSQVADISDIIFIGRSTPMYRVFNLCFVPATEIVCERTTPQPKRYMCMWNAHIDCQASVTSPSLWMCCDFDCEYQQPSCVSLHDYVPCWVDVCKSVSLKLTWNQRANKQRESTVCVGDGVCCGARRRRDGIDYRVLVTHGKYCVVDVWRGSTAPFATFRSWLFAFVYWEPLWFRGRQRKYWILDGMVLLYSRHCLVV